jgi:capsular exopolysaccharide synthesis family protein
MDKKGGKVLLVSSTVPEEGKSLITVNLALAFAQNNKKVLVIDGDIRNPSVLKLVDTDDHKIGLSNYFKSKIQPDDIIIHKGKLDIIPGGTVQEGLSGLSPDSHMEKLMVQMRERYDMILIDTPPSHLFSDSLILSRFADGVVYVVRHDTADLKEIKDGISGFIKNQKLLGYVINCDPGGFASYGKYGYGKYGYGKYGYGKYDSKYQHYIQESEESMNTEDSL